MCRALHLGVQKALGVVASHYQVDLEAVSMGYVVPVGVDDEVAPRTSRTSCSRTLPWQVTPKPKDHWAFVPSMF
jgi:hypothetical protein